MTLVTFTCPVCGKTIGAPKKSTPACSHKGRDDASKPALMEAKGAKA